MRVHSKPIITCAQQEWFEYTDAQITRIQTMPVCVCLCVCILIVSHAAGSGAFAPNRGALRLWGLGCCLASWWFIAGNSGIYVHAIRIVCECSSNVVWVQVEFNVHVCGKMVALKCWRTKCAWIMGKFRPLVNCCLFESHRCIVLLCICSFTNVLYVTQTCALECSTCDKITPRYNRCINKLDSKCLHNSGSERKLKAFRACARWALRILKCCSDSTTVFRQSKRMYKVGALCVLAC